jgi:hypothetical protein
VVVHPSPRRSIDVKRTLKLVAGVAGALALAAPVVLEPALAAGGDFGPNTCLTGFVWREAFVGDVVCVTPDRRTQAAQDNAAATSRRAPSGGAFGPNTCLTPFVWREASVSDVVCVTSATRSTTRAENAAAASRRNSVVLTLSRWVSPNTTTCDGNVCTTENDSAVRHRVVVTNINVGKATLRLVRSSDRRILKSWTVTSSPFGAGGRVAFKTNQLVCSGTPNAYFRIQDPVSGRWSAQQFVRTGCVSL